MPTRDFIQHPEESRIRQVALANWLTYNGLMVASEGWWRIPRDFDSLIVTYFKAQGSKTAKDYIEHSSGSGQTDCAIADYIKKYERATSGLTGAEDFARFGIDDIWFATIPTSFEEEAIRLKKLSDIDEGTKLKPGFGKLIRISSIEKVQRMVANSSGQDDIEEPER